MSGSKNDTRLSLALDSAAVLGLLTAGFYFIGFLFEASYLNQLKLPIARFLLDHTQLISVGFKIVMDVIVHWARYTSIFVMWLSAVGLLFTLEHQSPQLKKGKNVLKQWRPVLWAFIVLGGIYLIDTFTKYARDQGRDSAYDHTGSAWSRVELKDGHGTLFGRRVAQSNDAIALQLDSGDVVIYENVNIQSIQSGKHRFQGVSAMPVATPKLPECLK